MTTTLSVRFVLGRYHATPWGQHVNEGQVELPPSPWRLLRALYAVWQGRRPDLEAATVAALLTRLAEPPVYFVPPHTLSHTRHWFPDSRHRTATSSTDRTLDAFAAVDGDEPLGIQWRTDLPPDEAKTLQDLAVALPYLGRADSLVEANLDHAWQPTRRHTVWAPLDVSETPPDTAPARSLLAPILPLDLDALLLRPVDVRAGKLLFPRSTRFVGYTATEPTTGPEIRRRAPAIGKVEAVRFTITNRIAPPHTEAVAVADLTRGCALALLGRLRASPKDSVLAGRHEDGTPMTGHQHAHFLAIADPTRRLRDIVVWAPAGFDEDETAAVCAIRTVTPPASGMITPRELTLRVAGYGYTTDVLPDLSGPALMWESDTPFIPPRHQKATWDDFLIKEINRELAHRGRSAAAVTTADRDWGSFVCYRPTRRFATHRPDRRAAGRGAFVKLTFAEPQTGPIALGHLAHFGLGLFRPVDGA